MCLKNTFLGILLLFHTQLMINGQPTNFPTPYEALNHESSKTTISEVTESTFLGTTEPSFSYQSSEAIETNTDSFLENSNEVISTDGNENQRFEYADDPINSLEQKRSHEDKSNRAKRNFFDFLRNEVRHENKSKDKWMKRTSTTEKRNKNLTKSTRKPNKAKEDRSRSPSVTPRNKKPKGEMTPAHLVKQYTHHLKHKFLKKRSATDKSDEAKSNHFDFHQNEMEHGTRSNKERRKKTTAAGDRRNNIIKITPKPQNHKTRKHEMESHRSKKPSLEDLKNHVADFFEGEKTQGNGSRPSTVTPRNKKRKTTADHRVQEATTKTQKRRTTQPTKQKSPSNTMPHQNVKDQVLGWLGNERANDDNSRNPNENRVRKGSSTTERTGNVGKTIAPGKNYPVQPGYGVSGKNYPVQPGYGMDNGQINPNGQNSAYDPNYPYQFVPGKNYPVQPGYGMNNYGHHQDPNSQYKPYNPAVHDNPHDPRIKPHQYNPESSTSKSFWKKAAEGGKNALIGALTKPQNQNNQNQDNQNPNNPENSNSRVKQVVEIGKNYLKNKINKAFNEQSTSTENTYAASNQITTSANPVQSAPNQVNQANNSHVGSEINGNNTEIHQGVVVTTIPTLSVEIGTPEIVEEHTDVTSAVNLVTDDQNVTSSIQDDDVNDSTTEMGENLSNNNEIVGENAIANGVNESEKNGYENGMTDNVTDSDQKVDENENGVANNLSDSDQKIYDNGNGMAENFTDSEQKVDENENRMGTNLTDSDQKVDEKSVFHTEGIQEKEIEETQNEEKKIEKWDDYVEDTTVKSREENKTEGPDAKGDDYNDYYDSENKKTENTDSEQTKIKEY